MREHNFQRQIVKLEQENAKQAAKIEEQRVEIDKLKNDCRTLLEGETKAKNDGEEVETRYRNANVSRRSIIRSRHSVPYTDHGN